MKRITQVEGLAAAGHYSFATVDRGTIYTAGQIGLGPDGKLVDGGVQAEAHRAMQNLGLILGATAVGYGDVLKATVYLTDVNDSAVVDAVYASYFEEGEYPARETTVVESLLFGAQVEISMVATQPEV